MTRDAPLACACCGRPAHRATERIWNPHHVGTAESRAKLELTGSIQEWRYTGDKILLRKEVVRPGAYGSKSPGFLMSVTVWDGETWKLEYDPFCTLRCALRFARAAYRAEFRMKETPPWAADPPQS